VPVRVVGCAVEGLVVGFVEGFVVGFDAEPPVEGAVVGVPDEGVVVADAGDELSLSRKQPLSISVDAAAAMMARWVKRMEFSCMNFQAALAKPSLCVSGLKQTERF
jgi:hypothetical protein